MKRFEFLSVIDRGTAARLGLGVVTGTSIFLVELAFSYLLQVLLRQLLGGARAEFPAWIPTVAGEGLLTCLAVAGVMRALLFSARGYLYQATPYRFQFEHRRRVIARGYHDRSASASRVTELFNETVSKSGAALRYMQAILSQATSALMLGAWLLWVSPVFSLIAASSLIVLAIPTRLLSRLSSSAGVGVVGAWTRLNFHLHKGLRNLTFLRISGTLTSERERVEEDLHKHLRFGLRYAVCEGAQSWFAQVIGVVFLCGLILFSRRHPFATPELFIGYLYLLVRFIQSGALIASDISALIFHLPYVKMLHREVSGYAAPAPESVGKVGLATTGGVGWRLENVRFHHPGANGDDLFANLQLTIPSRKTTVIVGPSGAGKSTLLGLLLGECKPSEGTVEVTVGVKRYPLADVRSALLARVGYVGPEPYVIDGTIEENLLYGLTEKRSEEELVDALTKSEASFVLDLPGGLRYRLRETGEGLSSGQKQRLALARALLRRPSVLVLDEMTANLDVETERRVVRTLGALKKGVTIIAVTHRAELLAIADMVIELPLETSRDVRVPLRAGRKA